MNEIPEEKPADFSCITFKEVVTGGGQRITIECRPEDKEKFAEIAKLIRCVEIPVTREVKNVSHGGFGRYTRYDIEQKKYAGGMCGFIECIKVNNPPDNRCGNIIYEYDSGRETFYEFETIENAQNAWEKSWSIMHTEDKLKALPGFIRQVKCGWLMSPWFYAVANQALFGDFAFPNSIGTDHPIYRPFQRFLVQHYSDMPTIKTCMGCRIRKVKTDYHYQSNTDYTELSIYWDDGTEWTGNINRNDKPKPLGKDSLWIAEAQDKFNELLAGQQSDFTIDFVDGSQFKGKWRPKDAAHHIKGRYNVLLTANGKTKEIEWDFEPTPETPTVEKALEKQAAKQGLVIQSIGLVIKRGKKDGEWLGVYPPSPEPNPGE